MKQRKPAPAAMSLPEMTHIFQQFDGAAIGEFMSPGTFAPPSWGCNPGLFPQPVHYDNFNCFSCLHDYEGPQQPSNKQGPLRLDLAEAAFDPYLHSAHRPGLVHAQEQKRAASFKLSDAAPEFVPAPPGLAVADSCHFSAVSSDLQPLRVDLSAMASAPPGLPPPPGLEAFAVVKECAAAQSAFSPVSTSTTADSFADSLLGEDLLSSLSMSSDEADAASPKAAAAPLAGPRVDVPRELRLDQRADGRVEVQWPVDARKLLGKDRQIISSSFEPFPNVVCKLMIKPKPKGLSKGLASFQKARGCGSVELKIVEGIEKAPAFSFWLSIGSGDTKEAPRGPAEHTFASSSVCGLPKDDEDWDFRAATDVASMTFLVTLEALASVP